MYDPVAPVLPSLPFDPDPTPTGPNVLISATAFSNATSISFPATCMPFAASRRAGITISSISISLMNSLPDLFNASIAVLTKRSAT